MDVAAAGEAAGTNGRQHLEEQGAVQQSASAASRDINQPVSDAAGTIPKEGLPSLNLEVHKQDPESKCSKQLL